MGRGGSLTIVVHRTSWPHSLVTLNCHQLVLPLPACLPAVLSLDPAQRSKGEISIHAAGRVAVDRLLRRIKIYIVYKGQLVLGGGEGRLNFLIDAPGFVAA